MEDESGFSLVSPLRSSWTPRGQTPCTYTRLNHHQRLNLLGAIRVSPSGRKMKLSMRSFRVNLRGEHVILFLKQILRRIAGPIVLVWDNHPIHQRGLVQNFIQSEPRLHVYTFPACAPELNPVEFVWRLPATRLKTLRHMIYLSSLPKSGLPLLKCVVRNLVWQLASQLLIFPGFELADII